jgi:hypothetical protein
MNDLLCSHDLTEDTIHYQALTGQGERFLRSVCQGGELERKGLELHASVMNRRHADIVKAAEEVGIRIREVT